MKHTEPSSNAELGRRFEQEARDFFSVKHGIKLDYNFKLKVGIESDEKGHNFDLGCKNKKIIVECKSHKWTSSGNIPSAKMTIWNEAMYYFHVSPPNYRKIMFVLYDYSEKRNETLAEYYLRTNYHLIPQDVEFWEYDEGEKTAKRVRNSHK
tara:strand:+ start:124 stop:579 length:456 start_codon:yes stop_codon:yes gene_type:complete